jgi:hypothetical protein
MVTTLRAQIWIASGAFSAYLVLAAQAQAQHDSWSGPDAQKCAVVDCTSTTPDKPEKDYVEPDTSEADAAAETAKRYDDINATANQLWASATAAASPTVKLNYYAQALQQFRAQQAMVDGPKVRDAIDQIETLQLWTEGVVADENQNYGEAFKRLGDAMARRPELFTEGNYNYAWQVNEKILRTTANAALARNDPSAVVPDRILGDTASERVFYNSPPGVTDRVRKGFQAVTKRDWKVARVWFQDALNLDPQNANLKSLIAIIDEPPTSGRRITPQHGTVDAFGTAGLPAKFTPKALGDNANRMSNGQIMGAIEDIIDEYRRTRP